MDRRNIASGGAFEDKVGYSRAVRVGPFVSVSGTVAFGPDGVVGPGDMYAQAIQCLKQIEAALAQAGATMADVFRTRMYVTDISRWEEAGRAHAEFFGFIRPCATMVEVKALIAPEYLIEIEADAVAAEGSRPTNHDTRERVPGVTNHG